MPITLRIRGSKETGGNMSVFLPLGTTGVVKIGDACYQFKQNTVTTQPIQSVGEQFDTCDSCEEGGSPSSSEPSSSPSSSEPSSSSFQSSEYDEYSECQFISSSSPSSSGSSSSSSSTSYTPPDPSSSESSDSSYSSSQSSSSFQSSEYDEYSECQFSSSSSSESSSKSSSEPPPPPESSSSSEAPMACGTPNGDPTLLITLTWTDADATKTWLGCTWTNGEEKEVYSTSYIDNLAGTTSVAGNSTWSNWSHKWQKGTFKLAKYLNHMIFLGVPNASRLGNAFLEIQGVKDQARYATGIAGQGQTITSMWYTSVGVLGVSDAPKGDGNNVEINKPNMMPASYTDSNGITYAWKQGNGWPL